MLLKLSSKGQLVIPKEIRDALLIKRGDQFQARVEDGKIILQPVMKNAIQRLYGKYAGKDLLGALEEEHRQEIASE